MFLIANKDTKWTSFPPVSGKNSQGWFLVNMCLLCAVKPVHTDTFIHGIPRVWIFDMLSEPVSSLQCPPAYPAGQLHVHVLAAFEYIHADCPAGWLASLLLHFKGLCSFFFHPNSQYSLDLYNLLVICVSTHMPNLAEAKQAWKWFQGEKAGSGWEVHSNPAFVPLVTCQRKWWLNIGHKAQILSLGKSRTWNGSCKNVHPRQGLVWCVLFWAVNRKNSWPSDTAGDKECGKLLCARNSHGYVELVVCSAGETGLEWLSSVLGSFFCMVMLEFIILPVHPPML